MQVPENLKFLLFQKANINQNFFLNSKRLRKAFIFVSHFMTLNLSYQRSDWIVVSKVQGWKPSSSPSCLNCWVFHSVPEKVSIYSDWAVFQITCTLRPLGPLRSIIYVHTDAFNLFKMYECSRAACIDGCECVPHWNLNIQLECRISRSSTKIVLKSEEVQCEPDREISHPASFMWKPCPAVSRKPYWTGGALWQTAS